VPLELVQRVTGHRTVEVVMKHNFRPGREDFRAAILKAMPKMLADGGHQKPAKADLQRFLERMAARTWRSARAEELSFRICAKRAELLPSCLFDAKFRSSTR